ncbi:hypothetical protein ILUMI_10709 [Ignelater luminosus]|uniref:Uncharacterized protein n=1 Tax=Ignelater luminosus TaxID=2038154 RepID=A0A8K0GB79_IGNLU|nr:hypothetical protein ILUMI_10709 [Ignelater luminosus]
MYFKLSVCVALCLFVPSILGMSDEMQELIDMLHKTCMTQSGADDALITKAQKGDFTDDGNLKCYMKCLMSEMSTISDDGEIDVEAAIAILPEDQKVKMEPTIRKCGTQKGADACDNAFLTFKCYYDNSPADFFLP